jgi:hypothetical protein
MGLSKNVQVTQVKISMKLVLDKSFMLGKINRIPYVLVLWSAIRKYLTGFSSSNLDPDEGILIIFVCKILTKTYR